MNPPNPAQDPPRSDFRDPAPTLESAASLEALSGPLSASDFHATSDGFELTGLAALRYVFAREVLA